VESLRIGLNRAYDMVERRPWWLLRLESVAYVLVGAVAILAFSFLVVLVIALMIVHGWLPAGRRSFIEIAPGITATLMLWLISGAAFGRYLANYAFAYVSMYAGLASAMIALIFLYVCASIFIYGGELNSVIAKARVEVRKTPRRKRKRTA